MNELVDSMTQTDPSKRPTIDAARIKLDVLVNLLEEAVLRSRLVPVDDAHRIRVHFNADHSEQLPWKFIPQQKFVNVLPGETSLAFYKAKNVSNEDIIGIATYNVTPDRVSGVRLHWERW